MQMVKIEVIFDTICPWCYVGLLRLDRALAMRPHIAVHIVWQPFFLNPDMPSDGMPRALYLERKFGSRTRVARMLGALDQAGHAEGIRFDFQRIAKTPNTAHSHRLIALAATLGSGTEAVKALFTAYFGKGADIGDPVVLREIGAALSLPIDALDGVLGIGGSQRAVQVDSVRAHRLGVSGVPCYVFDDTYAVAGAQEPQILLRLLDLAYEARREPAITVT